MTLLMVGELVVGKHFWEAQTVRYGRIGEEDLDKLGEYVFGGV